MFLTESRVLYFLIVSIGIGSVRHSRQQRRGNKQSQRPVTQGAR